MAITLHLQHTFSTRVVVSSAEVQELRDALGLVLASYEVAKNGQAFAKAPAKDRAAAVAQVTNVKSWLALDDEQLVLSVMKSGVKDHFKSDLAESLKEHLFAKSVSPIQTTLVTR